MWLSFSKRKGISSSALGVRGWANDRSRDSEAGTQTVNCACQRQHRMTPHPEETFWTCTVSPLAFPPVRPIGCSTKLKLTNNKNRHEASTGDWHRGSNGRHEELEQRQRVWLLLSSNTISCSPKSTAQPVNP